MLNQFITYTLTVFKTVCSNLLNFLNFAFFTALAYISPISVNIIAALSFVFVDLVLGYKVSRKFGNKKLQSNLLWDTWYKMVFAVLLIVGFYTIDAKIITSVDLHLVEISSAFICVTELVSWLELMATIRPNCKFLKVIRVIFGDVIQSKSEKYLGKKVDLEKILRQKNK